MVLTTSWQVIAESPLSLSGTKLQIRGKYSTQSTGNNTSTVQMEERIVNGNASFHCYTHSANFTGGTFDASDYQGSYYHGWERYTDTVILSQEKAIRHSEDGTLGFNIGAYFTCSAGVNGTIQPTYVSLPTINRRSALTLSKSTFNIGDEIQATITQYVSAYHQDLYMVIGNNEVLIQSSASGTIDVDTSLLANQIYQQIPNAKYYDREFRLKTFDSNNNLIGTDVKSYRANVVDSEPTFDVVYEDIDPETLAITNNNQQIIQNQSALRISITNATSKHYSNLSSVSVTINGITTTESISSASKNVDIGTINVSNNTNAQVSITDSRGFTTTKTVALTILEWHIPNAIITLQRQQNFYSETDITVDANYSSLDNKNTISIQCRYKKTSDSTWGAWNNLSDNVQSTFNLDNTYSWDVEVKLTDSLESYTYTGLSVGIGLPPFFIDRKKRSLGVNCFPQKDKSIEINGIPVEVPTLLYQSVNGELGNITLSDSIANYRKIKVYFMVDTHYQPSNEFYTYYNDNIEIQLSTNWNGNGIVYSAGTSYSISGTTLTELFHYHSGQYSTNVGHYSGTNNMAIYRIEGFK